MQRLCSRLNLMRQKCRRLKRTCKKTVRIYAMTDEGCAAYSNNCDNFTWGDMINATDSESFKNICKKMGLKITWLGSTDSDDFRIDENEQLMEDIYVNITDIELNTDEEQIDELPSALTLDLRDPTEDIADVLSDEYGFCIKSYSMGKVY